MNSLHDENWIIVDDALDDLADLVALWAESESARLRFWAPIIQENHEAAAALFNLECADLCMVEIAHAASRVFAALLLNAEDAEEGASFGGAT